jgi:hypothetical protein
MADKFERGVRTFLFVIVPFFFLLGVITYKVVKVYDRKIEIREYFLNQLSDTDYLLKDAIRHDSPKKIKKILKEHPEIIEESKTNTNFSILYYAIIYNKYDAVKTLLEEGYKPGEESLIFLTDGVLATFKIATGLYEKKDWVSERNIPYIDLLLSYNAPTQIECDNGCPLSSSIVSMIGDKKEFRVVKLLVEKGHCDVNYTGCSNFPPVCFALKEKNIYAAHYLIVKHKTDLTGECARLATCALLPQLECAPGSEEEKLKEEIIQELKTQGIDYEPTDDFIFRSNQDFKSLLSRLAQKAQEEKNWWSEHEATSYFLSTR